MKKTFAVLIVLLLAISIKAQSNISVRYLEYDSERDEYKVHFLDADNVYLSDHYSTSFVWYLSYKDKRVSDYFTSSSNGGRQFWRVGFAWPGEVPKGHEKYVSAQIGKEPRQKDRRDDDI